MTGRLCSENVHAKPADEATAVAPDSLEIAPGTEREKLEGWVPSLATEEEVRNALEKAFDFRGDIAITLKSGTKIEGYLFDRQSGPTLSASFVRVFPKAGNQKVKVAYADVAALAFSDRDPAAGKSWEAWLKKYQEKKAAGEKNIALEPEPLE